MSDAKHTPGPWRYLEDHDGDAAGQPLTVCDASNNDLANIYSRDDATVDISRRAAIANARLIAAAPDLLVACDELVVFCIAQGWSGPGIDLGNAALVKARGGA